MDDANSRSSWLERLSSLLLRSPDDREELIEQLHEAARRGLLDNEALGMLEGVLAVSEMRVSEVMVPRSQMDVLQLDTPLDKLLAEVVHTAHSRFPVIDGDKDNVVGILLAKDLLRYLVHPEQFSLAEQLRPVHFVPESKPLNLLLKDFRSTHHHMAIVVDEFGGVAGLVTIEDVLEEIVGDIEDEFDHDDPQLKVVALSGQRFRVDARLDLESFNEQFLTQFDSPGIDTIGGLVMTELGHLPTRGEHLVLDGWRLTVLRADARRLHTLMVQKERNSESAA